MAFPSYLSRTISLTLVGLVGFTFSVAFLTYYYPAVFNSDSAAHQVLAHAMAESISVLPKDFYYGNQLLFFRNNFFIAVMLLAGFKGYGAYVAGSALSFTFFFIIAFLTIESIHQDWRKSFLICILYFLPLGHSEIDFLHGQQSHLANVVFALAIAVGTYHSIWHQQRCAAMLTGLVVLLVTIESPVRTYLVIIPLIITIVILGKAHSSRNIAAILSVTLLCGYVANRQLVASRFVAGIGDLPLLTSEQFISRCGQLFNGFVDYYIGFDQFHGMFSNAENMIFYASKMLLLFAFVSMFCFYLYWLATMVIQHLFHDAKVNHLNIGATEYLGTLGVIGIVTSVFITASIGYGLDVRHFLWALEIFKLAFCTYLINLLTKSFSRPLPRFALMLIASVLSSNVLASIVFPSHRAKLSREITSHINWHIHGKLAELMRSKGVYEIYGTHWTTLRLEVLIPPASASVLSVVDGRIEFNRFLTRPSRRCTLRKVFYLFDTSKAEEDFMARKLTDIGGETMETFGTTRIYFGPPIWDQATCN